MVTAFLACLYIVLPLALFGMLAYIADRFEKRYPQQNRRTREI